MKKITRIFMTSAACLTLLAGQAFGQGVLRNVNTVVGDALQKLPATDMALYDQLATELVGTGAEGLTLLKDMLERQDDSMVAVEYAIGAICAKATAIGGEQQATVANLVKKFADEAKDETIKEFMVRQLMVLGVDYGEKNKTVTSALDLGTTAATGLKELAKTIKKGDKKSIFDALYRVGDIEAAKDIVAAAIPAVKSDDTRSDLIWWLGEQKDSKFDAAILPFLTSAAQNVKSEAAWALTKTGSKKALPILADMVAKGTDAELAAECLKCFPANVADAVAPLFTKASDKGKQSILGLLGGRCAKANKDIVFGSLFNNDANVSKAAYDALASVVDKEDLITLFTFLESSGKEQQPQIQNAILAALEGLCNTEKFEVLSNRKNIATDSNKSLYWPMIISVADLAQTFGICKEAGEDADLAATAVKSYLDKVAAAKEPGAQQLLRYRAVMEYANTDELKNAVLNCIGNTGAFPGIFYAAQYLDNPATKQAAAIALRKIATSDPSFYGPEVVKLMNSIKDVNTGADFVYDLQRIEKYLSAVPTDDQGYLSMFNGKDLSGWQGMVGDGNPYYRYGLTEKQLAKEQAAANQQMAASWAVKDGTIEYVGTGYDNLVSAKKYKDFEMYIDWIIYPGQPDGDAGIYLRSTPQVQIWDTARTWVGAEVGSGGLYNNRKTESTPNVVADNPVGEWNSFYIKMVGERVTVYLNGQLVVDNIVMENYWNREEGILPEEYIELQAHGSRIGYRDIYIHELPSVEPTKLSAEEEAEGFEMLFDGTGLQKWHGNKVDYNVVDGEISVESRSRGSSWIGDLYTNEEYADFIFRFEFKLTKGANNGVGVRAPGVGDAAYEGYEVQILDHYDAIYQPWLKDYQYHGSLYGIIPAKNRDALKPVGEWNSEEIYMKGSYIRVTVNGQVVTEGDIAEATANGTYDGLNHPGLNRTSGYIGFLGHGDHLWIRNVRAKHL